METYIAHGGDAYTLYVLAQDGRTRLTLDGTYETPRAAIAAARIRDWDDLDEDDQASEESDDEDGREAQPETREQRRKRIARERREGRR